MLGNVRITREPYGSDPIYTGLYIYTLVFTDSDGTEHTLWDAEDGDNEATLEAMYNAQEGIS